MIRAGPGAGRRPRRDARAARRPDPRRRQRHRPGRIRRRTASRDQRTRFPSATAVEIALDAPARRARHAGARASAAGCSCSTSPSAARCSSTSRTWSATSDHRRVAGSFDDADHDVRAASRARWRRGAAGEEHHARFPPPSGRSTTIGDGLVVTGISTLDELPEAIEAAGVPVRARRPVAPGGRRAQPGDRRARAGEAVEFRYRMQVSG